MTGNRTHGFIVRETLRIIEEALWEILSQVTMLYSDSRMHHA